MRKCASTRKPPQTWRHRINDCEHRRAAKAALLQLVLLDIIGFKIIVEYERVFYVVEFYAVEFEKVQEKNAKRRRFESLVKSSEIEILQKLALMRKESVQKESAYPEKMRDHNNERV